MRSSAVFRAPRRLLAPPPTAAASTDLPASLADLLLGPLRSQDELLCALVGTLDTICRHTPLPDEEPYTACSDSEARDLLWACLSLTGSGAGSTGLVWELTRNGGISADALVAREPAAVFQLRALALPLVRHGWGEFDPLLVEDARKEVDCMVRRADEPLARAVADAAASDGSAVSLAMIATTLVALELADRLTQTLATPGMLARVAAVAPRADIGVAGRERVCAEAVRAAIATLDADERRRRATL